MASSTNSQRSAYDRISGTHTILAYNLDTLAIHTA